MPPPGQAAHLKQQLRTAMRVASDRIAELERQLAAAHAVADSFAQANAQLRELPRRVAVWQAVALATAGLAAVFYFA